MHTTDLCFENDSFSVNNLCEDVHQRRKDILGKLVFSMVLSHQETLLLTDIGPRYSREKHNASFKCPCCYKRVFTRKGLRNRVFKSVLGRVILPVVQVICVNCCFRFCPYKDHIGLTFKDRISPTLMERQMDLTCKIPYHQAREFIKTCLGIAVSPMRIRKQIDQTAKTIRKRSVKAENQVVYVDATKVKAGNKQRGASIHLAMTASPLQRGKRAVMKKRFLFLKTGDASQIKKSLKALQARGIVHDGDMDLSGCAPFIQRCLWHLPHQLKHFLWMDGMAYKDKQPWVKRLIKILYGTFGVDAMKVSYSQFTEELKQIKCMNAYNHLKNAEKELTISKEQCFYYHTTAPNEREMREINRRADVGVRWSVKGVENLLLVKMSKRLNKP